MLSLRNIWVRLSRDSGYLQQKRFCNSNSTSFNKKPPSSNGSGNSNGNGPGNPGRNLEAYRELHNLDFQKAAKILFSDHHRKKKFGLDFHLVQLFFALMPSLAVYLVAQYARHEMRKMDAELEKKKAEEEAKVKEMERLAEEEKGQRSVPELLEVKERLQALEETMKVIVVQTKKQPIGDDIKNGEKTMEKEDPRRTSNDSLGLAASQNQQSPQLDKHKDGQKPGFHQGEKK